MSEFDPKDHDPVATAVTAIEQSAADERYDIYAAGAGPLSLPELDPEVATSEDFMRVFAEHGWPSKIQDGAIEPVYDYGSSEAFVEALRGGGQPHLNNLNALFAASPTDEFDLANIYGLKPALHRSYAIAPDLFKGIHDLYSVRHRANLTDVMRSNRIVADQLWKAFDILGRLVKMDDVDREIKRIDPGASKAPVITSAQEYLST